MIRHPAAIIVLGTALVASALMPNAPLDERIPLARIRVAGQDDSTGVILLKRAIQLHSDKNYAAAIATYDSAAAVLPQLADWIAVFAAASASYQGDTIAVARRLAAVGDTLAAQWGWRSRVRALATAKATERALQLALAAARSGSASKRADAWYRVAELRRDLGDAAGQRRALLAAINTAPESGAALDAALALAEKTDLSPDDRVTAGRALMRNGEITRGVRELGRALKADKLNNRSQVRYDLGRVLFSLDRYAEAIRQLERVARGHPRRIEARFLMARALYRSGKVQQGRRLLRDVADAYPESSAATRALFLLGDLAQDDGEIQDAIAWFERAARSPARTSQTGLALMRLGGIAYMQGNYQKAAAIFGRYQERYPDGEYSDQATYWIAQTALRRGNQAEAKQRLLALRRDAPFSYYGVRAAELLGDAVTTDITPGAQTPPSIAAGLKRGMDRWELLRRVGWYEAASVEFGRVRRSTTGDRTALYALAEELQARDAPHIAIEIGRSLLTSGAGWDTRLLRIMYPLPFQNVIEREARARGLDPYLVAGVIRQESRFNTKAQSGAGAIGLMQVMPRTGKTLAGVTPAMLTDAELNIQLGTKFLADLMDMYDRRLDAVLVAYNAGPSRAYNWRKFPEYASEDLFIERIPFEETRDYVKVVKLNTAIYHALYGSDGASGN